MRIYQLPFLAIVAIAIAAGCGGGGGSSVIGGGGGGGGGASPSPAAGLVGELNVTTGGTYPSFTTAPAASDELVFSCGCSAQAGIAATNGSGDYTVTATSTATPAVPSPQYTLVPTRNYIVVAEPASLAGPQAWTVEFAGNQTAHNLALGDAGAVAASSATSDAYTAAAALYVYNGSTTGSVAFDDWNFNEVEAYTMHLASSPTAKERTLLNDIAAQGGAGASLFPTAPGWNTSQPTNATINTDIKAVAASYSGATPPPAYVPTPCPISGGNPACTNTPSP